MEVQCSLACLGTCMHMVYINSFSLTYRRISKTNKSLKYCKTTSWYVAFHLSPSYNLNLFLCVLFLVCLGGAFAGVWRPEVIVDSLPNGAGRMAQWLRALVSLPSMIPSIYMAAHNCP